MVDVPEHKKVRTLDDVDSIDWGRVFGKSVSVQEIGRKDVGVSFEPRIKVSYVVTEDCEDKVHVYYHAALFVLSKNGRRVHSANLNYYLGS